MLWSLLLMHKVAGLLLLENLGGPQWAARALRNAMQRRVVVHCAAHGVVLVAMARETATSKEAEILADQM